MCYNLSSFTDVRGDIMRILIFVLLLPLFAAASEPIVLSASCDAGGGVSLLLDINNTDLPQQWVGLKIVRELVGSCDKPDTIHDDLLPLPAPGASLQHEVQTTIDGDGLAWRFTAVAVDGDGIVHATNSTATDHAFVSQGNATFFRGRVEHIADSRFRLAGCDARCWPTFEDVTAIHLGVTELQMVVWATHNTTLYVVGDWNDTSLAEGEFADVYDVKVTSSCGAIANEPLTWSALKSSYR